MTEIAANADNGPELAGDCGVTFTSVAGQTYSIALNSTNGVTGVVALHWTAVSEQQKQFVFKNMFPTLQQPWYFNNPEDAALDGQGNIYVADTDNFRVVKLNNEGILITTWGKHGAGATGPGLFSKLSAIAASSEGIVYTADNVKAEIQAFTSDGNYITSWSCGQSPYDLEVSPDGMVYVATTSFYQLEKYDAGGNLQEIADIYMPPDVDFVIDYTGRIVYTDDHNTNSPDIIKVNDGGDVLHRWPAPLWSYENIAVDTEGSVYVVTDPGNVVKVNENTQTETEIENESEPQNIRDLLLLANRDFLILNAYYQKLDRYSGLGDRTASYGSGNAKPGYFSNPAALAVDTTGNIYVADKANHRLQKLDSSGFPLEDYHFATNVINQPASVLVTSGGHIFTTFDHSVLKFTSDLALLEVWGSYGSGNLQFSYPQQIAQDALGNFYVADRNNDRVQKISPDGEYLLQWGGSTIRPSDEGKFSRPVGIAVDSEQNVYVSEEGFGGGNRIQKFTSPENLSPCSEIQAQLGT